MTIPPFRSLSLLEQLIEWLRQQIRSGVWRDALPSERILSEKLGVSRPILRRAIHELAREGVLQLVEGAPCRVAKQSHFEAQYPRSQRVVLLYGTPSEKLDLWAMIAIDHLRRTLYDRGFQFDLIPVERLGTSRSMSFLERLVEQYPADFWILAGMSEGVLHWFRKQSLPATVMGSSFPGINFSSVNDDLKGTSRHAAGVFIALGHKHIVHFSRKNRSAGEIIEEAGFREAFAHHPELYAKVIKHDGEKEHIRIRMKQLFSSPSPPTAILISHAMDLLVVHHWLLEHRIPIPTAVSLISFQWDPLLERLNPLPAWYFSDPLKHAQHLVRQVLRERREPMSINLASIFFKNESVSTAPAQS